MTNAKRYDKISVLSTGWVGSCLCGSVGTLAAASVSEANRPQDGAWAGDEQRILFPTNARDVLPVQHRTTKYRPACVAQLVEQRIRNAQVAGSSPATSSKMC